MLEFIANLPASTIYFREIPFYSDWNFWSAIGAVLSACFSIYVFRSTRRVEYELNKPSIAIASLDSSDANPTKTSLKLENKGRYTAEDLVIEQRVYNGDFTLDTSSKLEPNQMAFEEIICSTALMNRDHKKYFLWIVTWRDAVSSATQKKVIRRVFDPEYRKRGGNSFRMLNPNEWPPHILVD